jgi:hypothetical protein
MDFTQRKLSRSEWDSIEIPVSTDELEILKLIIDGYSNVNISVNKSKSIFTFMKIEYTEQLENYLFNKYLEPVINELNTKYDSKFLKVEISAKIIIKSADKIRIDKTDINKLIAANVYEYILINHIEHILKYKSRNNDKWLFHYFTLFKIIRNNVLFVNAHVLNIVNIVLRTYDSEVDLSKIIGNSDEYIERNNHLLYNADMNLYDHQKQIFTMSKDPNPKLILYIAPTGTGKTLTPLGLSEQHKIIFVCAARHVGLALARAAISMHKRIAFAFGCDSAENVRLHYFAAKEYTKNTRTGGIFKVDNSVGDKVEIIICDIKSYIPAMFYMLAFNRRENIITYWDEPTITMDYDAHEFHDIIQKNWNENLIPNVILSSATLPKIHELTETVTDFQDKFHGARIYNIVSHDCRKSIPLINKNGFVEMPHYMSDSYDDIIKIAEHCENYLTLLRYFDLKETSRFISYVETLGCVAPKLRILRNFGTIDDIDMKSIKMYYIQLLKGIDPLQWEAIHAYFKSSRIMRVLSNDKIDTKGNKIVKTQSIGPGSTPMTTAPSRSLEGKQIIKQMSDPTPTLSVQPTPTPTPSSNGNCAIYVTTKDAHTLTDGPTIFIVNDIDKIARFCIQQSNIPVGVMNDIMEKISFNNKVNENIRETEKSIEDLMEFSKDTSVDTPKHGVKVEKSGKTKKMDSFDSTNTKNKELRDLSNNLSMLQSMIKLVSLNETFVPNKILHLAKWTDDSKIKNAFTSDIDEETVISIMMLDGVEDSWKILLLLGIGVFTMHKNIAYTEIMKKLADTQKLYMIIASSDYIYGTNYQFCHGYISKDLVLTQEKIIQALGRIGRNNIQHEYSIRFRDDEQIKQLFKTEVHKPEVVNMNRLFNRKI